MAPLLRLIVGNLRKAHTLGMIACGDTDISNQVTNLEADWNSAAVQNDEFERCMRETKSAFDRQFRPIQAFRGRMVPFCNVMRLSTFSDYWLDQLDPSVSDPDADAAKEEIKKQAAVSTTASVVELQRLSDSFIRFNQWIANPSGGRENRGITVTIGQILDPTIVTFWVGGRVLSNITSAQFWRDRLGLIGTTAGARACGNMLVRLRFVAKLADEELPRDAHLEHRSRNQMSSWLFRPSVLHRGNRRFVQGVAADRTNRPARRGSTRDLSVAGNYREGERELLLLTGELAEARLLGVDLLDGFADSNPGRDDNDHDFVENIARQHAWD